VYCLSELADVYMIYGHRRCNEKMFLKMQSHLVDWMRQELGIENPGVWPLRSNGWYLFRPDCEWQEKKKPDVYGGSFEGGNYTCWGCPACADPYTASVDNPSRIVVFGLTNKSDSGDSAMREPEAAYVGDVSSNLEHEMSLLKTAILLKEIRDWGDEPTKPPRDIVMQALDRLNNKLHERLTKTIRTVTLFAADQRDEDSNTYQKRIFLEDKRLSLAHQGQEVRALLYEDGSLPTLNAESQRMFVDFRAAFLDLDELYGRSHGQATMPRIRDLRQRGQQMRIQLRPPPARI